MKFSLILMFLAFCVMGSVAELGESSTRLLQYDDDSRAIDSDDIDNTIATTSGPAFPNGTPLGYWRDDEETWVDGKIVGFKDGYYYVRWDDKPGRTEAYDSHFSGDRLRLNSMKRAANRPNDNPPSGSGSVSVQFWANGTPVRSKNSDGSTRVGRVSGFNGNDYTVEFSNGKTAYFDDYDMLPMVQMATQRQRFNLIVSIVGTIAIVILLVSLWSCTANCRGRGQAKASAIPAPDLDLDLDLDEEDNNDEDEETGKDLPPIA